LVDFLQCTCHSQLSEQNSGSQAFRNTFLSLRRLSESQNKLPEDGFWKDFHINKVIKKKQTKTLRLFSSQKGSQKCEIHQRSYKKPILFLGSSEKKDIA
jgi:hypothetical protein